MGVGDSQLEAAFELHGPIPAGTWHLVGDGEVFASVDIRYDLLWRSAGGDVTLATWSHHFDPRPSGFDAVPFEADAQAAAVAAVSGDHLVLRFTASNTTDQTAFIPNGDGPHSNGRIPYLDLPH